MGATVYPLEHSSFRLYQFPQLAELLSPLARKPHAQTEQIPQSKGPMPARSGKPIKSINHAEERMHGSDKNCDTALVKRQGAGYRRDPRR